MDRFCKLTRKNMKLTVLSALLIVSLSAFANDGLPNPKITPGEINPNVTQENIDTTICKAGWTKTIRPSTYYTNKVKKAQMLEQNLPGPAAAYEEDHLISLELGGHPRSPLNLWPQLWDGEWGARKKDVIETFLKREVCARRIELIDAQHWMSSDWVSAYKKFIVPKKKKA
jgi:hypothetical protein